MPESGSDISRVSRKRCCSIGIDPADRNLWITPVSLHDAWLQSDRCLRAPSARGSYLPALLAIGSMDPSRARVLFPEDPCCFKSSHHIHNQIGGLTSHFSQNQSS